jgi:hypothetical protein
MERRMKKVWLILLLSGLIAASSTLSFAADVKFSGEFYVAGMYLDKTTLFKGTANDGPSTAFYFQRLRVQVDFVIAPGLSLITRFDAMERSWGATRANPSGAPPPPIWNWNSFYSGLDLGSAGTTAENQNIAFDLAYVQYASPIGIFTAGYQLGCLWGTAFGDTATPLGDVGWMIQKGPWMATLHIGKGWEGGKTATNSSMQTDVDFDKYIAAIIYIWKGGEVGVLYDYSRIAIYRPAPLSAMINVHSLQPYVKVQIGSVKVQAEVNYFLGKGTREDGEVDPPNTKIENLSVFLDAVADINKFYFGGTFAYLSGDDPDTADKFEGGFNNGGFDWNPCLIMWNRDRFYWAGFLPSYATDMGIDGPMQNAWFGQIRGGVRPLAGLDVMASVSYANADKTRHGTEKNYGTEVDLIATYKINNNLSYMLGAGYLFTGDYFKGGTTNNVADNFLIINKLTLTF